MLEPARSSYCNDAHFVQHIIRIVTYVIRKVTKKLQFGLQLVSDLLGSFSTNPILQLAPPDQHALYGGGMSFESIRRKNCDWFMPGAPYIGLVALSKSHIGRTESETEK